jgi:hypothetical protein
VVALENLRLLAASQRRARREEIIREITGKIRSTTNVDDILKTTVTELGKVLGAPRGGVVLGMGTSQEPKPSNVRKDAGKKDTRKNARENARENTRKPEKIRD